jgi:hypothetical protein
MSPISEDSEKLPAQAVTPSGATIHIDTTEGQNRLLKLLCQEAILQGKSYAIMRNEVLGFLWMKLPPLVAERLESEFIRRFAEDESELKNRLAKAGGREPVPQSPYRSQTEAFRQACQDLDVTTKNAAKKRSLIRQQMIEHGYTPTDGVIRVMLSREGLTKERRMK